MVQSVLNIGVFSVLRSMQQALFLFVFGVVAVHRILYWTYVWQLKEYRMDRMRDFFSTPSGKSVAINTFTGIEGIFLCTFLGIEALYSIGIISSAPAQLLFLLFFVFLVFEALIAIHRRTYPVVTAKATAIALGSLAVMALFFVAFSKAFNVFPGTVAAIVLVMPPLLVAVSVVSVQPVVQRQKQYTIERASQKIKKLHPIVIGITGSYGKTTTKEYLAHVLKNHFSPFATPQHVNSDIGVAKAILDDLLPTHTHCVIEMGAYTRGEIKRICDMTAPIIGVVTGVNNQHIALFGSAQAILDAKSELVEALPSSGLAVLNLDSATCARIAERTSAQTKMYSMRTSAHTFASDITVYPRMLTWTLHIGSEMRTVQCRLFGEQTIPSMLAAATVAHHLGLSIDDIAAAFASLSPIEGTMNVVHGIAGTTVIDDHYNSNPDGFLAALTYLAVYPGKKVVMTAGMLELGPQSFSEHVRIGRAIASHADALVITKKDFAKPLVEGALKGGMDTRRIIMSGSPRRLIRTALANFESTDTILIEGRIQNSIVEHVLHNR